MKYLIFFLFLFTCSFGSYSQGTKYALSDPIDIKETGWNKVLCMKNGNTLLFHLENNKPLVIMVFDSLHKQVATQGIPGNVMDISLLKETIFQGLFEINGEAVLFLDQVHQSKHCLIRLRFSGTDGKMTEEKRVDESPSMATQTDYTVVHTRGKENYSIVYCTDNHSFNKCDLHVTWYDSKHEQIKNIPIDIDRKSFDNLGVIGAQEKNDAVCVTMGLYNKVATTTANAGGAPAAHCFLQAFIMPKDAIKAWATQVVDLSTTVIPANTEFTYNAFANTYNILMMSYKPISYKLGDEWQPAAEIKDLFLRFDDGSLKLNFNWINNKLANDYLQKNADTTKFFTGIPLLVYTNENGLSTMIAESYSLFRDKDMHFKDRANSYLGNIAITQYDDDGKEIWGTVMPKNQCFRSYNGPYDYTLFSQKNQSQAMFADDPAQVYERQFLTVNTYTRHRNFYMLFNDDNNNFSNSVKIPGDTVYGYENTNACYYLMDRKKEITKKHLFGEPGSGEYISCFTEGADFIEQSGLYASLVRDKKGDNISLRMAWCWLD